MKNLYGVKFIFVAIFALFLVFNCAKTYAAESFKADLTKIENDLWGLNYQNETDAERLSRVEISVFGASNSSAALNARINKINKALGLESQDEVESPLSDLYTEEAKGVNYPVVDNIELQLFNKEYKSENIYKRLERIEKKVFGAAQKGDLAQRTDSIKAKIAMSAPGSSMSAYPDSYSDAYDSVPYQGGPSQFDPNMNNWGQTARQDRAVYDQAMERTRSQNNSYNNFAYGGSDGSLQVAGLESTVFGQTFSQDPMGLRLNRLERKIFQRDFASDDEYIRLERLQAASSAKKTAKYYDNNKFQKYASSGVQIGTLLLMILAFIL